jgi:signal transduction histidine kinase
MNGKATNPLSSLLSNFGNLLIRLSGQEDARTRAQEEELLHLGMSFQQRAIEAQKDNELERSEKLTQEEKKSQAEWMRRLAEITTHFDIELGVAFGKRGEYIHVTQASDSTDAMLEDLYSFFAELGTTFNTVSSKRGALRVRVTVSDFYRKGFTRDARQQGRILYHFRLSTVSRQLLVVGKPGKIHFNLAPAASALNDGDAHSRERRKLSLRLAALETGSTWTVYGLPVTPQDIRTFQRMLFRDLIILSAMDAVAAESGNKFEHVENIARFSASRGFRDSVSLETEPAEDLVRDLLMAQQNAVHKLLNQQEETQATIARDLHDGVLADILMLRRKVSSDSNLDPEQISAVLDSLTDSIRDICSGLVPRDLKDWGLETVLQDLVDKVAEQTEADCSFEVEGNIPELPSQVQLHIFRIVQECLNNVKKYADADSISVRITANEGKTVLFKIQDDGKGFDLANQGERTDGGFGLPGIEERVEIIKAFYPTRFKIESTPGEGTTVQLELIMTSPD